MLSDELHQPPPALSVQNVTKRYRGGKLAVDNISFTVHQGAFFGFLGPNGAGKTTTISCIAGIAYPTEGSIAVFGYDVVSEYQEARRRVGLSPQEFNIDIFATTKKILEYSGGYYGMTREATGARAEELMSRFGLSSFVNTSFRELSGGYKRRVMLARALMHDPELLILDEPSAGVDVELRHELWRYLEELNQTGKTIILTSHYIEEVERLCNEIAIIARGRLVAHGPLEDFTRDGRSLEAAYLSIARGEEHSAPLPV